MQDNFNISEWKYKNLIYENFNSIAHDLVLDVTEKIKDDYNKLDDDSGKYYAKTLMDNLQMIFKYIEEDKDLSEKENPCWDGYEMVGMKEKDGKSVPNCVPIKG